MMEYLVVLGGDVSEGLEVFEREGALVHPPDGSDDLLEGHLELGQQNADVVHPLEVEELHERRVLLAADAALLLLLLGLALGLLN
jgi:hypothetical protein